MRNYVCPTCGRADFAHERDMKAHHTIAHGEPLDNYQNSEKCPTCGEVFASKGGMRAHHKIKHGESIAESRSVSQSIREQVIERDESHCQRCHGKVAAMSEDGADFHLHHIIPFAAGGADHPDNLVLLCTDCHNQAHRDMKNIVNDRPDLIEELRAVVCGER